MGDDDELSPAQKLTIAENFIINSPPAQQSKVVEDVRTIVGADLLSPTQEAQMLQKLNTKDFAAVQVPSGGYMVLLTPHGELPGGLFLDPKTNKALRVNHATGVCEGEEDNPSAQPAPPMRKQIDDAMQGHVTETLPHGVLTTYGSSSTASGVVITCCVAALEKDLGNYWAGRWWGEWKLTAREGSSRGELKGEIKCNVHYFEDGNVQLTDCSQFSCELPLDGDVGAAFKGKVAAFESEFIVKLEDIYQTLSEQVIQSLRRRLPITRTKFDWDKPIGKLALDLQTKAAVSIR